jgi:superfamily I DNA and RNA helicase
MKVSIEFDIDEDYDRYKVLKVVKSDNTVKVIEEIMSELRRMTKYETCDDGDIALLLKDDNTQKVVEYIRELLHNQLIEHDIGELF